MPFFSLKFGFVCIELVFCGLSEIEVLVLITDVVVTNFFIEVPKAFDAFLETFSFLGPFKNEVKV